jgi:polyisoprenoid-binding protein YceI
MKFAKRSDDLPTSKLTLRFMQIKFKINFLFHKNRAGNVRIKVTLRSVRVVNVAR